MSVYLGYDMKMFILCCHFLLSLQASYMFKWRIVLGYFLSQTPSETSDTQDTTGSFCDK